MQMQLDDRMTETLPLRQRLLWFVGIWSCSVATLGVLAEMLRHCLPSA